MILAAQSEKVLVSVHLDRLKSSQLCLVLLSLVARLLLTVAFDFQKKMSAFDDSSLGESKRLAVSIVVLHLMHSA